MAQRAATWTLRWSKKRASVATIIKLGTTLCAISSDVIEVSANPVSANSLSAKSLLRRFGISTDWTRDSRCESGSWIWREVNKETNKQQTNKQTNKQIP